MRAALAGLFVLGFVPIVRAQPRQTGLGWSGLPAVNYGPGDPLVAHTVGEHVPLGQIAECETKLLAWLGG